MEDVGGYRLIWFQHLHKAAGTLIVNMAKANNEVLHNPHNNGNPSDIKGSTLPLWEYDESGLLDFINNCEEEGVTFVASEFGAPNFKTLSSDPRVKLMTCFRDPCKRIISNHNYDYYSGYTENYSYFMLQTGSKPKSPISQVFVNSIDKGNNLVGSLK